MMVSRYWFYLAQSYRDAGEHEKAIGAYLERAKLGQWREEVCVSLYNAAQISQRIGRPEQDVLDLYARAFMAAPHRAEGLHGAAAGTMGQRRLRQRLSSRAPRVAEHSTKQWFVTSSLMCMSSGCRTSWRSAAIGRATTAKACWPAWTSC